MKKQKLTKNIDLSQYDLQDQEAIERLASEIKTEMEREGKTLEEVIGINPLFLEQIYAFAYTNYNAGKFTEALHLFDLLVALSPKTFKFLLGSASCLYQLKAYRMALVVFYGALYLNPSHALIAYYIADCMLKEGFTAEAVEALENTIQIAGNNPEFTALKERCQLMRNAILKK